MKRIIRALKILGFLEEDLRGILFFLMLKPRAYSFEEQRCFVLLLRLINMQTYNILQSLLTARFVSDPKYVIILSFCAFPPCYAL